MSTANIPYSVIGAAALAARGLPRMTADLDIVVLVDNAADAIAALTAAGFRASTPTGTDTEPEPMIVFVDPDTGIEVDLLNASGDPESCAIDEATEAMVLGTIAPVATLEHLLLLYLYSNQPKHMGDFASIVCSGLADLAAAERKLAAMHPEMLDEWVRRVHQAQSPAPAPARPPARRRDRDE